MNKIFLALILALAFSSATAYAGTAYYTGRFKSVQAPSGRIGYSCEYAYNGNFFWRDFEDYCPSSISL